jgi:hypothetical protein
MGFVFKSTSLLPLNDLNDALCQEEAALPFEFLTKNRYSASAGRVGNRPAGEYKKRR